MRSEALVSCRGCGALVPDLDGPTHRYIGASPGCWQFYGELLVSGYGTAEAPAFTPEHRIMSDTYAAQHPGVAGKQSSQSVAAHLVVLCLVLECGLDPSRATEAITRFLARYKRGGFRWVEPPTSLGPVTLLSVLGAEGARDYSRRILLWARSVWEAWAPYHSQVRAWAESLHM